MERIFCWELVYDRCGLKSRPRGRVAEEARRRERFWEFWKEFDWKFGYVMCVGDAMAEPRGFLVSTLFR